MRHPYRGIGPAAILLSGGIGILFGCMGMPEPPADGTGPADTERSEGEGTHSQCEQETYSAGACELEIRVRQEAGMTPAIHLLVHEVDTQKTLRTMEIPYVAGAPFHTRLKAGTYHVNLLGSGSESLAFPPLTCRGNNERIYWERDLRRDVARLQGRITGHKKKVVQGVELLLQRDNEDAVLHVPIDGTGGFSIALPVGDYQYLAIAPGHGAQRGELRIAADRTMRMPLQLDWRPVVRGWVRGEDGAPVKGAHVFLGPSFNPKTPANVVLTDAAGRFEIPVVPQAGLRLSAWTGEAYAVMPVPALTDNAHEVTLSLTLQPGRELGGWVQTTAGRPHAFGTIRFRIKPLGMVGKTTADVDGRFSLRGLPWNAEVEVWAEGNASGAWGAVVAGPAQNRVLVTYQAPAY